MTARRYPVLLMVRELGIGGTERQLTETVRGLDRSVFEPHVACMHASGFRQEELRDAGVPIVSVTASSFMSPSTLRAARTLGAYLRQHQIQLTHTFDTPMNVFGVPTARLYRVPVVLSSQRAYRELTPPVGQRLLRVTDRLVNGVVVNCRAIERHLVADEGVPASRIRLCYNGIDTSQFFPGDRARPAALAGASTTIGVVCAMRPEKDLATLLRAFARVRARAPEGSAKLVLVGSGPSLDGLQALGRELGIADDCHFEPATTEVARWLRAIDIFVLPSRSEALSNSLMEAMACGCCPVASEVGGNPELVVSETTGLLFRGGDDVGLAAQLQRLIDDRALQRGLADAAARTIARDFTLPAMARRMGEIYLEYLTRSAR